MAMAGLVAVAELCKGKQLRGAVAVADVISSVITAILSLSLAIYNTLSRGNKIMNIRLNNFMGLKV